MVIIEFLEYSHERLTPEEIEQKLIIDYKDINKNDANPISWEEYRERRTRSNRHQYSWETVSSERIIGKSSMTTLFNSVIVPWLKDRLQDLQNFDIYDSDYFNLFIIDDDYNYYSFNIQKKDDLRQIVAKIKELVNINILDSIRIDGPVDGTGKNFIENKQLYDRYVMIEKVKVV